MGTITEGADETYERFCDRLLEDVEIRTSRGGWKEEDRGEGGQVESNPSPPGILSGFCGS